MLLLQLALTRQPLLLLLLTDLYSNITESCFIQSQQRLLWWFCMYTLWHQQTSLFSMRSYERKNKYSTSGVYLQLLVTATVGSTQTSIWPCVRTNDICCHHRVTTCHRSWRHRRLETERWPPLKSIIEIRRGWLLSRRDIQSSLWLAKRLLIGWLINIPPFFGFQFGRRSWPRPWLLFDWLVMYLENI